MTRADLPVSVVIPTFGRHDQLADTIASAVAELRPSDEIVVVDDGSSPPIALSRAGADGRKCKLVRLDVNRGPASARNAGIAAATNPLIAFLDSDDLWLPGKLAAQRRTLATAGEDLVAIACGWEETTDGRIGRTRRPRPSASQADFFAGCWFCPGSTLLVEKRAFDLCGPQRDGLRRLEDTEWFLRFARAGGVLRVADHVGARIAHGGRGKPQAVDAAASAIASEVAGWPDVSAAERRSLRAYLDLERAAARRNAGQIGTMALHLARSFLHKPRVRLQLADWWPDAPRSRPPA